MEVIRRNQRFLLSVPDVIRVLSLSALAASLVAMQVVTCLMLKMFMGGVVFALRHFLIAGGVGSKYSQHEPCMQNIDFQGVCYIGDSIGTNAAVYKRIRREVARKRKDSRKPLHVQVCLFCRCFIHQFNVVRRTVVYQFDHYWANLARLAHLFESAAFKRRFRAAFNQVLVD